MGEMTSTNVFCGFSEDTRSSSRVLRPPGGGHTDIFGAPEPAPARRDHGRNASSITEGTNATATPMSPPKTASHAQPPQKSEPPPAQSGQRGRVPPGGFSSGLW